MALRKDIRDKIVAQVASEISFARRYKQGKIATWHKNEQMYYGKKEKTEDARANVGLGRMQEFIHTLLSKVDNPLTFVFQKRKESQLKRVRRLNSLKEYDAKRDFWDLKDIVGKKQAVLYGRAIYFYYASSDDGYLPHLENSDVYDFLIDPDAGGIDVEKAKYLGRYGVKKDRADLKKNKNYIRTEVDELLAGSGNSTVSTQEETNKQNRQYLQQHSTAQKNISVDTDKFVFWEWFTTYEGERYYLLITEDGKCAVRIEKLKDMFASNMWPVWTYAAFPDLTEFWTPSYADYAREIFMAQEVSINQMLDNAEQINKPTKYVDTGAIQNLSELKYKRGGNTVKVSAGFDVTKAVRFQETPSIRTPIEVFNTLEEIQSRASGVTAGAAGVADTDGRATIYEGNQANVADRFGLFNKTYAFGYQRFANLYQHGVKEHLVKKEAIDIIGPEGIEVENVGRRDIFKASEQFPALVESSNAELTLSEQKRRTQTAFLSALLNNPLVNQKELVTVLGTKAMLESEELRRLLDVDNQGSAEVMSEAARDMEDLLDGKVIKPNRLANTAYKQYFVNYMQDHEEDMTQEEFVRISLYVRSLDQIIVQNTLRKASEDANKMMQAQQAGGAPASKIRAPGPAQPLQDVIEQNVQS